MKHGNNHPTVTGSNSNSHSNMNQRNHPAHRKPSATPHPPPPSHFTTTTTHPYHHHHHHQQQQQQQQHTTDKESTHGGQYRIHFLSALASVPVPFVLMTGMPIYTVSANGKTQPATLTFSTDRFTAYIRHHSSGMSSTSSHNGGSTSGGGGGGGGNSVSSGGGGGGGLSRAPSEKSLLGSSLFALGFTSGNNNNHHNNNNNSNNDERAIDIGEMDRVQRGQSTQQFELAKKNVKVDNNKVLDVLYKRAELQRNSSTSSNSSLPSTTAMIHKLDPALSFSIIFRGAHTVDVMAQTEKDRDMICNTLDQILQAYRRSKNRVSTDILLLRYVWLDVDKAKTGYVSGQQFWQALQAMNFNKKLKEVASDYEKFGRTIGLDKSERKRGLTFEQSATFLHKVSVVCVCCWAGLDSHVFVSSLTRFITF